MEIWAVFKDPGGINSIVPVIELIKKQRPEIETLLIANGRAISLLPGKIGPLFLAHSVSDLNGLKRPDILLTSMCSFGGVGRDLVPIIRNGDITSVAVQDYWGSGLEASWADPIYRPSFICVGDAYAASLVQKAWSDVASERIKITGFPVMDQYALINTTELGRQVRNRFNIPETRKVVLFVGDCLPKIGYLLSEVIKTLNNIGQQICLITRQHPRMVTEVPEEVPIWNETLKSFRNGQLIDNSYFFSISAIIAASDLVIGLFSTTLGEAAALRKNSIALLYPHVMEKSKYYFKQLDMPPVVTLGCSIPVKNQSELEAMIRKALTSGLGLRENQERHFRPDGRNAQRVADVVIECLDKNKTGK